MLRPGRWVGAGPCGKERPAFYLPPSRDYLDQKSPVMCGTLAFVATYSVKFILEGKWLLFFTFVFTWLTGSWLHLRDLWLWHMGF